MNFVAVLALTFIFLQPTNGLLGMSNLVNKFLVKLNGKNDINFSAQTLEDISHQDTFRPISILPDFFNLSRMNNISPLKQSLIQNVLIPEMTRRLQMMIRINGPSEIFVRKKDCGDDVVIPQEYTTAPVRSDLIIFITSVNDKTSSYIASAIYCTTNSYNRRPSVGMITFNENSLEVRLDKVESMISTAIHETLHILAFCPSLYESFPASTNQPFYSQRDRLGKVTFFRSPRLLQYAREYFGCPTLDGIALENDGGDSSAISHFERVLLGNEMMVGEEVEGGAFSLFSLKLLADTGWYQVEERLAE